MLEQAETDKILVGILIENHSDLPKVATAWETLDELGIHSEIVIASIQKNPDELLAYLDQAHAKGVQVLIDCAGIGNFLTDAISGYSSLPEIGIPAPMGLSQPAADRIPSSNERPMYRSQRSPLTMRTKRRSGQRIYWLSNIHTSAWD